MNIPNLPTDNLYKFIALSGLFLAVFSITIAEIRITKLQSESDNLTIQVGELEYKTELLFNNLGKSTDTTSDEINDFNKISDRLKLENFKLSQIIELQTKKAKRIKSALNWSAYGLIIGSLISFYGFVLWYNRVQKLLDYKLKKEILIQQ